MKQLICKWLNLIELEKYIELYHLYVVQTEDFVDTIDKYNMQNAWQQVKFEKEERKRRLH